MMAKLLDFPFFLCLADVVLDNDTLQWLCSPARKFSAIAQSLITADPRPFSALATQTNRCLRWNKPQAVQYPFKRGGTQKYPNATPIVLGHFHYRSASSCQKQRSLLIYIYIHTDSAGCEQHPQAIRQPISKNQNAYSTGTCLDWKNAWMLPEHLPAF